MGGTSAISYKLTSISCYIAYFALAIVVNLTPVLFIPLKAQFGFSYTQLGALIFTNFITQVLTDLVFSRPVERYGFRKFLITGHLCCVVGLASFALVPFIFKENIYFGFLVSTILFSIGGGLFELMISPIVDSIPKDGKDKSMALAHSFYAWGQAAVIAITTLLIFMNIRWQLIILIWTLIPAVNAFLFFIAPLPPTKHPDEVLRVRELFRNGTFMVCFVAVMAAACSELIMSQWSSSFMEKGLGLPKVIGDMLGMCGFAITMGIGRMSYGIFGSRINLQKIMIYGSAIAAICYLIVAVSPFTWLSIVACILTGFCVSMLWPGTLTVASMRLPLAGASMFAILAAGGDIGASIGPSLTGLVADTVIKIAPVTNELSEQFGLRAGILVGAIFPILAFISYIRLQKSKI